MATFLARVILLAAMCMPAVFAEAADDPNDLSEKSIGILVSRDIRPYLEALGGITREMKRRGIKQIEVFEMDKFTGKGTDALTGQLEEGAYHLVVAIGPEAAGFVAALPLKMFYTLVLTPSDIVGGSKAVCGISLTIPLRVQLDVIHHALPEITHIGILHDPAHNADFVNEARETARNHGVEILPLAVTSRKDIPAVLNDSWGRISALWLVPDPTVISESIVQYIAKEALLQKVALIGFNRFFYDNGAAVTFVFDYQLLGQQTAALALQFLDGSPCGGEAPVFSAWLNERVIKRLGITAVPDGISNLETGP